MLSFEEWEAYLSQKGAVQEQFQEERIAMKRSGVEDVRMFEGKDSCSERVCVWWGWGGV